jgi:hypothetical protein
LKTFIKLKELLWPTLDPFTDEQIKKEEERNKKYGDMDNIVGSIEYIKDESYAEEFAKTAKSLFEDEEERLKTVENKSVTLLSATGLIITLVVNFSDQIIKVFTDSSNKSIWYIILICFASTIAYFFTSVIYSLRGLERKGYSKLDVKDIIDAQLQDKRDYFKKIAALSLSNRVKNYKVINDKVDCVVMSHLFFKRGIIALVLTGIFYMCSKINFSLLKPNIISILYINLFVIVVILVVTDLIFMLSNKKK